MSSRRAPTATAVLPLGSCLVLAGVVTAALGTAIAMLPGGYNPFGPSKAFVLLGGVVLVALGFTLAPALPLTATHRALAQRGTWPALGLVGIALLSTLTSIDPEQSLVGHYPEYQGLLLLLAAAFAAFGAYSLAEEQLAWRVIGLAAVVALLAIFAYALVQFFGVDPVPYAREFVVRRVRSTPGNSSNLGVVLVLALPLAIARARNERGAWRWLALAASMSGAVALAWSLSRGAWVGALAGALGWLVVEGRSWSPRVRIRVAGIAVGVAVVALAATVALVPNARGRLADLLDPTTGTAGWRTEVWSATTRLVAERPVLGFGPGSFRYAFPPVRTAATLVGETGTQVLDDPHNLLASTAVASGVLALLALVWLLGEALAVSWRSHADDEWPLAGPALAASIAGGVTALQFHFATLDSAPLLAVAIALAIGRGRAPQADSAPGPADDARPLAAARWGSGALVALAGAALLMAGALVEADRQLAEGYTLTAAGAPWVQARAPFERAEALALWEPATGWALGRAATQWVSAQRDAAAADDAIAALEAARKRLSHDTLLLAQTAEAYLVTGITRADRATIQHALELADEAIALDPQNGFRWTLKGAALQALGDDAGAQAAFERAVAYSPNDGQAWMSLAGLYERNGDAAKAAHARDAGAAASGPTPTAP